jgi:hypothetical protein
MTTRDEAPTLTEIIEEHRADDDHLATAKAVLDAINCPSDVARLLLKLVYDEVRRTHRQTVRRAERFDAEDEFVIASTRAAYMNERFAVGGHRPMIRWAEATVADHIERINYLESFRAGIARTIDKHHNAIGHIVGNDVTCLAEVPYVVDLDVPFASTAVAR